MNSGPLGVLPRLTSAGHLVNKQPQTNPVPTELNTRPHSYRGYSPEEFIQLVEQGVSKRDLRPELRDIEAGRFNDMLKEAYDFWVPLDLDEKEMFNKRNPELVAWLETYAVLEELRRPSEDVDIAL